MTYIIGGGILDFKYGNIMTSENPKPTTAGLTAKSEEGTINDFTNGTQGIEYARPVKRYSTGYCHGIGLAFSTGLEYFIVKNYRNIQKGTYLNVPIIIQYQTPRQWNIPSRTGTSMRLWGRTLY